MGKKTYPILTALLILFSINTCAQDLTGAEKNEVLNDIIEKLQKIYPFPEVSEKTIAGLMKQMSDGNYDQHNTPVEFATQVSGDLEEFSNDKHLDLNYDPDLAQALLTTETDSTDYTKEEAKTEIWNNYGFKELRILPGNIGYLNLSVFFATDYAGKTADISMNYFANCNALIIDLRQNGGGWGDMVDYLLGYFVDANGPLILNITQSTLDSSVYSEVVPAYVPGKKLTGKPIYILTSSATASAAEAFTSHLKYLNKSTEIIGEKTAGAENPVEHIAINDKFVLQIPAWKKIYSLNPDDWEGVGIKPDIEVEASEALKTAHLKALKKLLEASVDQTTIDRYQWAIDGLSAGYKNVDVSIIKKYSGSYGKIKIIYRDNKLYYQREDRRAVLLIPVSEKYYIVEGTDYFRIKFIRGSGSMILKQIFDFGMEREYMKSE